MSNNCTVYFRQNKPGLSLARTRTEPREAFGAAKPSDISWSRNFPFIRALCIFRARGSAVMTARTLVLMPVLERGPGALAVSCLVAVVR